MRYTICHFSPRPSLFFLSLSVICQNADLPPVTMPGANLCQFTSFQSLCLHKCAIRVEQTVWKLVFGAACKLQLNLYLLILQKKGKNISSNHFHFISGIGVMFRSHMIKLKHCHYFTIHWMSTTTNHYQVTAHSCSNFASCTWWSSPWTSLFHLYICHFFCMFLL